MTHFSLVSRFWFKKPFLLVPQTYYWLSSAINSILSQYLRPKAQLLRLVLSISWDLSDNFQLHTLDPLQFISAHHMTATQSTWNKFGFPTPQSQNAPKTFSGWYDEIDLFLKQFENFSTAYSLKNDKHFKYIPQYVKWSVHEIIKGLQEYTAYGLTISSTDCVVRPALAMSHCMRNDGSRLASSGGHFLCALSCRQPFILPPWWNTSFVSILNQLFSVNNFQNWILKTLLSSFGNIFLSQM